MNNQIRDAVDEALDVLKRLNPPETPYSKHMAQMRKRLEESTMCNTWESRPLLCRLAVHRPNVYDGVVWQCTCTRCGYTWKSVRNI